MDPRDVFSVKHRHRIKQLIAPLHQLPDFAGFAIGLVLRSGKSVCIDSVPAISMHTTVRGIVRSTKLLDYDFIKTSRVFYPESFINANSTQQRIEKISLNRNVHRVYCYSRYCGDCSLIATYRIRHTPTNRQAIYKKTIATVNTATLSLVNAFLPEIIGELPELAQTRFAQDKDFRQRAIQDGVQPRDCNHIELTNSEVAALYWSAQGKTAAEIASILGLSKNTVDTYRRNILDKMQVSNITEAVYVAITTGLIT